MHYSINSAHDGSILVKAYADGGALLYSARFVSVDHVFSFFYHSTSPTGACGATMVERKNTHAQPVIDEIVTWLSERGYMVW